MRRGILLPGILLELAVLSDCVTWSGRSTNASAFLQIYAGLHAAHTVTLRPQRRPLKSMWPRVEHSSCGVAERVTSSSDMGSSCPRECPLYQEDHNYGAGGCVFQCVRDEPEACGSLNKRATVADSLRGICRSCWVNGCQQCAGDGSDRCGVCEMGYELKDGKCINRYLPGWYTFLGIVAIFFLVVVGWVINLASRPIVNSYAVEKGLELRSRAKLHTPAELEKKEVSWVGPQASTYEQAGWEGSASLSAAEASAAPSAAEASAAVGSQAFGEQSQESQAPEFGQREYRSYGRLDSVANWQVVREEPDRDTRGDPRREDSTPLMNHFGADKFASARKLWPLNTNLCAQDVAGPGVVLSFNFQALVILWALLVALLWMLMSAYVDAELRSLGTKSAATPRDHCIVLAWGYETQRRLLWAKVAFLAIVYIFSFLGALLHSVRQLRVFQLMDENQATHKDFAAKVTGIPASVHAGRPVEEELKELLEIATGRQVVGVSVCWAYRDQDQADLLNNVIDLDIKDREKEASFVQTEAGIDEDAEQPPVTPRQNRTPFDRLFNCVEDLLLRQTEHLKDKKGARKGGRQKKQGRHKKLLGGRRQATRASLHTAGTRASGLGEGSCRLEDSPLPPEEQGMGELVIRELESMTHTGRAWAIFNTEGDRDAAVQAVEDMKGIQFEGGTIRLKEAKLDPDSILWENCGSLNTTGDIVLKLATGGGVILLALLVWSLLFFYPYASYATSANYTYGQEPGFLQTTVFTFVVVGGNAAMYFICSEVADRVGFHATDSREVCYMLLYNFACVFQVILDLVVTYQVALARLVGRKIRTYDGTPVNELDHVVEKIESYPMQQELGRQMYMYAFPSTFLVPFLIEPFVTIYVPYQIMVLFIRTRREISSSMAEAYLSALPFDLSRYADIFLNIMLAVLIFFFPGGYTHWLFLGLVGSHIFIYCLDQWRILRSCPSCYFSTMKVDWWVQWMLCLPCGLILSALIFKSHCGFTEVFERRPPSVSEWSKDDLFVHGLLGDQESCNYTDVGLLKEVLAAFFLHVLVHTLMLIYIVPLLGRSEKLPAQETYEDCSRRLASSFFSTNPVHCLRSDYIFGHSPPCGFRVRGKEHLLRPNPDIGCYFEDTCAQGERYGLDLGQGIKAAKQHLAGRVGGRWTNERPAHAD